MPIEAEQLLTAAEVARRLHVSASWVRSHANGKRRPKLPCVRMGTVIRFEPAKLEEFLDAMRQL